MKVYRIYDPASKLYSAGGVYENWSKNGKTWSEHGLKGHLTCVKRHRTRTYDNCVIHEFESKPVVIEIEKYLGES